MFFYPRKTRKARNKLKAYLGVITQPLGNNLQIGIFLNIFVFLVYLRVIAQWQYPCEKRFVDNGFLE